MQRHKIYEKDQHFNVHVILSTCLTFALLFFFGRVPDFLFGDAAAGGFGAGVLSLVAGTDKFTRDIFKAVITFPQKYATCSFVTV